MIKDIMTKQGQTISFEVFPPKKDSEFESAFQTLEALSSLHPDFISVTYGAGGSRFGKTLEIASYIEKELHIEALSHITCVGSRKEDILSVARKLEESGVHQVLALRGDRPKDMSDEDFERREFFYASDLITFLKAETGMTCAGACYPEKHYECFSRESDIQNLKLKQDVGAEFFISQMFFDNDYFYEFLERADKKGITVPICAGIMPVTAARQLGTTISLSGASIPKAFSDLIAAYGENPEDMRKAGIDYAVRQILDLQANGVKHIHIYTMNKPKMAAEIMKGIGR